MKHRRENIIQKGQEIFRKNGYHATGVSTILTECGISKGTFYNYFSSKDEFAKETLKIYSGQIQKLINTYMGFYSMSPTKRLKRYFEQLIKINVQEGADKGCLLMNFMVELAGDDSSFSELAHEEFTNWINLLIPTIEEAQEKKEMTKSYSARQIASFLYLHLYGDFARMKTTRSVNQMETQQKMVFELLTNPR